MRLMAATVVMALLVSVVSHVHAGSSDNTAAGEHCDSQEAHAGQTSGERTCCTMCTPGLLSNEQVPPGPRHAWMPDGHAALGHEPLEQTFHPPRRLNT